MSENQGKNLDFDPGAPYTLGDPTAGGEAHLGAGDLIGDDGDEGDELAQMRQQMQQLQTTLAEERQQMNQRLLQLMQQPQQPQQPAVDPYDTSDLPDPVEKPDDFKRALSQKLRSTSQYGYQQATSQLSQTQRFADLENRFNTTYKDLSGRPVLLQTAAKMEADAMRAQGIDPTTAVFNDSDGFLSRVAARMRQELKNPTPEGEQHNSGRSNRTAGVSGGTRQPGGASRRRAAPEPKNFVDELKHMQLENGLI